MSQISLNRLTDGEENLRPSYSVTRVGEKQLKSYVKVSICFIMVNWNFFFLFTMQVQLYC